MGKVGISRRRWVLAGFAVVLGTLMLGVPGIDATNNPGGKIIVVKKTDPAGDPTAFEFILSRPNGQQKHFVLHGGEQRLTGDLDPGTYSVNESVPDGWTQESATCDDGSSPSSIDIQGDKVVTCTFVNTTNRPPPPKTGTITIQKQTIPEGADASFGFAFGETQFTLSDGQQRVFDDLSSGTYSVSESSTEGWTLTSATCSDGSSPSSINLSEGESVLCTFVNSNNPPPPRTGTIIVQKQTIPEGAETGFHFVFDDEEGFTLSDGEQEVFSELSAGTYSVEESSTEGWTLTSATCSDQSSPSSIDLSPGETVVCTFVNTSGNQPTDRPSSINVSKSVSPTVVKEPGGEVTYSITVTNTSADSDVTITDVSDDRFGDLDDEGGNGCFDVPFTLAPGESNNCQFTTVLVGAGGTSHVNVVTACGHDEDGDPLCDSDDARVDFTPKVIDLVIVKDATSPTTLNGTVQYTMTVTNKGPDTATNVQLADPAPVGVTYLTASPSQGTCTVVPALITCSLGTIAPGQTVTINATGRVTQTGQLTNTATVTGSGGAEANPADNTDSATTTVPKPLTPPTPKPTPTPKPQYCLALVVTPKMIKADGKPAMISVRVTAGKKAAKGVRVLVTGKGLHKTARTNSRGVALVKVNLSNPGLIRVTTLSKQESCGAKRIGVVGVFLPPVTG